MFRGIRQQSLLSGMDLIILILKSIMKSQLVQEERVHTTSAMASLTSAMQLPTSWTDSILHLSW